jgi:hypothetical protein
MELPSSLDGKVADPFYLIVSLGTPFALTPSRRRQIIGEMPRRLIVNWSTRDDGALGMVPRVYRMTSRAPDFSCSYLATDPSPARSERSSLQSIDQIAADGTLPLSNIRCSLPMQIFDSLPRSVGH